VPHLLRPDTRPRVCHQQRTPITLIRPRVHPLDSPPTPTSPTTTHPPAQPSRRAHADPQPISSLQVCHTPQTDAPPAGRPRRRSLGHIETHPSDHNLPPKHPPLSHSSATLASNSSYPRPLLPLHFTTRHTTLPMTPRLLPFPQHHPCAPANPGALRPPLQQTSNLPMPNLSSP